jgi:TPP-dependent pyruvate/acetoin dehydrogenase alpha subunit
MMAELFGRVDGSCKGKGGSVHIADVSRGMLGANGIVGGGPPLACGAGLTAKRKGTGAVCACLRVTGLTVAIRHQGSRRPSRTRRRRPG